MKKATIYNFLRLCRAQKNKCENCPMSADNNGADKLCLTLVTKYPDKANEIILKWCKEHPVKTRQDKFLEMFPNAKIDSDGVIDIVPCTMEKGRYDMTASFCTISYKYTTCAQCRKEYWLEEVDENE